mgnify:CR=1 FL=1
MDEETEVYTIYQRVTQIEKRHVTAPKGLTFNQLSDWVDENGVGDLLDIDELDNDMSAPITRTALMSRESGRIDYRNLPL